MKTWLLRGVKILVVTELVYLVLVNTALNLTLTQSVVNQIKPDKFSVSWERAWTFYPFRVHAETVHAKGQTRSLEWEGRASSASASISLLSLLWRTVHLDNIEGQSVGYYQRSRKHTVKNTADHPLPPTPVAQQLPEKKVQVERKAKKGNKAWHILLDDIRVDGEHELQINQVGMNFSGMLQTGLDIRTKGGPFSLENGKVDIDLESLVIGADKDVISGGYLKGNVEFLPFVPRENKGMKVLNFLNVEAELETETSSLAFLNGYLANYKGMNVGGAGTLQGRLRLQQGELLDDTDIRVDAKELTLDLFGFHVTGDGNIAIETITGEERTNVAVTFVNLEAFGENSEVVLLTGKGLNVEAQANRYIFPDDEKGFEAHRLAVAIPVVEVPDLSVYQYFFPDKFPVTLHGGTGSLSGDLELRGNAGNGSIQLNSDAADIGIGDYRFTTNLDTALHVDSPGLSKGVDISGTYFHLYGSRLAEVEGDTSKSWQTRIDVEQGKLRLMLPDNDAAGEGFLEYYKSLKGSDLSALLSTEEDIHISGSVSDLSWLNVLLQNKVGFGVSGAGEISATLTLRDGTVARGTQLNVRPQELGVEVLDYAAEGVGEVVLVILEGGEKPDVSLDVVLADGAMRRKNEEQVFIEEVDMQLEVVARDISFDGKGRDMDLSLQIPSAKVGDMAVYNSYLPENAPLQFTGGKADVSADIQLTPESAKGNVRLQTRGLTVNLDEQDIGGEITANILLADGLPENMEFDISGSSVILDKVHVTGDEEQHDDTNWSATFELNKAHAVWRKPIVLKVEAGLQMTDSKPIVAVLANQRGKHGWLEKALTIDDVYGDAVLHIAENRIIIPYAYAGSDKIDVGAKGVITTDIRDGVIYVRFRKLDALLKIRDGDRNLDVLKAREKYDQYDTDDVVLRMSQEG